MQEGSPAVIPAPRGDSVTLDDKWNIEEGRVLMNGTQALVRVLLAQSSLDRRRGLRTAGYVSGYRGSPLGNVDTTLWSIAGRLKSADIVFQPGLNEDIAATAIRGTQQLDAVPDPAYEGVYAAWYGKGPGVDRSGDALKHGNYAGAHRNGGVLLFYGDDHAGKSSTVAHQSEQALAANLIPSLYPADVQEILDYGLLGLALSRYSGSWVGIKCMNEVAEQTATVDVRLSRFGGASSSASASQPQQSQPSSQSPSGGLPQGVHAQQSAFNPLRDEQIVLEQRLPLVHRFVRQHAIDRVTIRSPQKALGLVTAGKSYGDVRSALALLGLDDHSAAQAGISLYKVGLIWPLEPAGLIDFSSGHRTLLVVEEKKSFLESQAASILINRGDRPLLVGKADEAGAPLLSSVLPLEPAHIACAIAGRLEALGMLPGDIRARRDSLRGGDAGIDMAGIKRTPYFCSGCPHNRSTQIPEGSLSMTGIGCHTMANFVRPAQALLPTQMGGEGANWIGLAPFTRTQHMFQNMGDGTYYHSGLLAIRAAVAAGVNITFKILYNDAVAMTGGQPVDGPLSVAAIAQQLRNEGVACIHVLSDDPARHRHNAGLPAGVVVGHRDTLDAVQRTLRATAGCSVLIYEQTCAAEKRRRRKRGTLADPPKRLFIAKEVCEGCGDCSVQSSCMSLTPVETELGRKRAIDQSNCNKDYSCVNGFCPSFITVHGAGLRKTTRAAIDAGDLADLPAPGCVALGSGSFNLMIAGIGGTGVITVGALLGMAGHMQGLAVSLFDMTGLSQKNGAVYTHVRLARVPTAIHSQRLGSGETDVLLAFDLVAALSPEAAGTLRAGGTRAIANADVSPTVALQFERDFVVDAPALLGQLQQRLGSDAVIAVDAAALAADLLGDSIGANLFMLGIAAQSGILPVTVGAIEAAVTLNGVAVALNIRAFRLGRLWVADRARVMSLAVMGQTSARVEPAKKTALPDTFADLLAHRAAHLTDYQGPALARRYTCLLARVQDAETRVMPGVQTLSQAVAHNYAKVLAYKDEYEVARLLTCPSLRAELRRTFEDGGRVAFNLAPPLANGRRTQGRPAKREFGAWILPLLTLLAQLRGLRGSVFDPFGRTAERRMERALILEYETLVESTLQTLTSKNHGAAVRLLAMFDEVRGFGPVKQAAVDRYQARVAAAQTALRAG
jgi:indolepyruvate ferredoxin oxidoreductase